MRGVAVAGLSAEWIDHMGHGSTPTEPLNPPSTLVTSAPNHVFAGFLLRKTRICFQVGFFYSFSQPLKAEASLQYSVKRRENNIDS